MAKAKELQINGIDDDIWLYDSSSDVDNTIFERLEIASGGTNYYAAVGKLACTTAYPEIATDYVITSGSSDYYIFKRGKLVTEYASQRGCSTTAGVKEVILPDGSILNCVSGQLVGGASSGVPGAGGGGSSRSDLFRRGASGGGGAGGSAGCDGKNTTFSCGSSTNFTAFCLRAGNGGAGLNGSSGGTAGTVGGTSDGGNGGTINNGCYNSGIASTLYYKTPSVSSYTCLASARGQNCIVSTNYKSGGARVVDGAYCGGNGGANNDGWCAGCNGAIGTGGDGGTGGAGGAGGSRGAGVTLNITPSTTVQAGRGGYGGAGGKGADGPDRGSNTNGSAGCNGCPSQSGSAGGIYIHYQYWI